MESVALAFDGGAIRQCASGVIPARVEPAIEQSLAPLGGEYE